MNEPTDLSPQPPEPESHPPIPAPDTRTLSAALLEDGDAVQSDLHQANELAAGLEAQLAGKSKEVMHLKFLLNQTKSHFSHLQDSVLAMRKERHKLANDAMRAPGLEIMVTRLTAERDRLRKELAGVLEGLAAEQAEKAQQGLRFDKRDHMIAELTFELVSLRKEVADLRRANQRPAPCASGPPLNPFSPETPANEETWVASDVEIVPTERVLGKRARG